MLTVGRGLGQSVGRVTALTEESCLCLSACVDRPFELGCLASLLSLASPHNSINPTNSLPPCISVTDRRSRVSRSHTLSVLSLLESAAAVFCEKVIPRFFTTLLDRLLRDRVWTFKGFIHRINK